MALDIENTKMENILIEIEKLIDGSKVSFVSYIDDEGYPVTKAFLAPPRERNGIKEFWLSTNTSSNKVKFLRKNNKASIYFMDNSLFRGVSLSGTMEIFETPEEKQRIWREGDTLFYPLGVTDPDYCVLKLSAVKGRYYKDFKSIDFEV